MAPVEPPENDCALPALGAEIAQGDLAVRQQAEDWIYRLRQRWAAKARPGRFRPSAWRALVLARMRVTSDMRREMLRSSHDEINRQIAGAL